jgi:L-ribulose-5-phosphate 3-epimerase UlaE
MWLDEGITTDSFKETVISGGCRKHQRIIDCLPNINWLHVRVTEMWMKDNENCTTLSPPYRYGKYMCVHMYRPI